MSVSSKAELEKMRNHYVVKSNELIQKTRFQLSLTEQKTIAYICSLIVPLKNTEGQYQLEYAFNIRDYCKICGIDYNNGRNYQNIKSILQGLSDRSWWLEVGEQEILCRWLSKVRMNKRSGVVFIKLDEDLAPYLFDLAQKFTKYHLKEILGMKSAYSIRVYEILKSYAAQKIKVIELDDFKRMLAVDGIRSYENFKDFRTRILEPSLREINELTTTRIEYSTVTMRKKVIALEFHINDFKKLSAACSAVAAAV